MKTFFINGAYSSSIFIFPIFVTVEVFAFADERYTSFIAIFFIKTE